MRQPRIVRNAGDDAVPVIPERIHATDSFDLLAGVDTVIICPRCNAAGPVSNGTCPDCGFPFVCDTEPVSLANRGMRGEIWRILLGIAAILFLLSSGAFVELGGDEFYGRTLELAGSLQPDTTSGVEISGPGNFVWRTQLALALLKLRAPDYYWRIQDSVTGIEYLGPTYMEGPAGRRINLEGIGAMAHPATGHVSVLYTTAFPGGPAEIYDRDLFTYAGVLVHELRHIELHKAGMNPGGWQEEVLCEQAAYAAVQQLQAPRAVLLRYETYLRNPLDRRYQRWYDWYNQWE